MIDKPTIIWDFDGVFVETKLRRGLLEKLDILLQLEQLPDPQKAYNMVTDLAYLEDTIEKNCELVRMIRLKHPSILHVIVTSRPQKYCKEVSVFIREHRLPIAKVYMRTDAQAGMPEAEQKKEVLLKIGKRAILLIDDNPQVHHMWRSHNEIAHAFLAAIPNTPISANRAIRMISYLMRDRETADYTRVK